MGALKKVGFFFTNKMVNFLVKKKTFRAPVVWIFISSRTRVEGASVEHEVRGEEGKALRDHLDIKNPHF